MAEQKVTITFSKSPSWRSIGVTGVAINTIGGPSGLDVVLHFTNEWADVEKETFLAEVTTTTQSTTTLVKEAGKVHLSPLSKMEEVAVRIPISGISNIIVGLLSQFSYLPAENQKLVRDAVEKLPK